MKILLFILLFPYILFSQNRNIILGEDIVSYGINYNTVYIAAPDNYGNLDWKQWTLQDIILTKELKGVLPLSSQNGMTGVGSMINGVSDSIFFTPAAANSVCPVGFRLPRVGEYDTLMGLLSMDERRWFFNKLPGYISHNYNNINDSIIKDKKIIKGGYWWTSTIIYNENTEYKQIGIEIDCMYSYHTGKGDFGDYAVVRCIRNKNEDE